MTGSEIQKNTIVLGPNERVGILAGSGMLPVLVAESLRLEGHEPFVIRLEGEADEALAAFDGETLELEHATQAVSSFRNARVTHMVLAGGVSRRPAWHRFRVTWPVLRRVVPILAALKAGDDVLLRTITRVMEDAGIAVVGAHEVVPRLLAPPGVMGRHGPKKDDWPAIDAAMKAARAIGALDVGQAAVAFGSRAIALEGIEGTDGLLERTRELRNHGRIASTKRGVLCKCAKPGQELRADMPTIGVRTVEMAHQAGLIGIAVEAGRSLILDFDAVVSTADRLGLFLVGLGEGEQ